MGQDKILELLMYMVPVILSITVHEFAHAYASFKLGDDTAYQMGRMSLNPIVHIDLFGTIIIPALGILSGMPFFGWAKPVPFNPVRFRRTMRMKHATLIVALAGPTANIILALMVALVGRLLVVSHNNGFALSGQISNPLFAFLLMVLTINVSLAVFNFLPVPPLDGSKILYGLLPDSAFPVIEFLEKYSFVIFIAILLFGGRFVGPPIMALLKVFYGFIFG
jgi:Zn-dependent protease